MGDRENGIPGVGIGSPADDSTDDYGRSDGRWLDIEWSRFVREVEVTSSLGRTSVQYVEVGSGQPILLIHGLAGSWRNWLENIPRLAENHRVVAIDLPGFGESPLPERPITMPGYGEVVAELADRLDLGPETTIVGHSMGGLVTTEAVLSAPEVFSRVCLVASAGITFAKAPRRQQDLTRRIMTLNRPLAPKLVERGLRRPRVRNAQLAGFIAHPDRIGSEIIWELVTYGATAPGFLQAAHSMAGYDARHRLTAITQPTNLIWGTRDLLVPVQAAYAYRKRIRHAELTILNDTGHMVMMERPARFTWEVEDFIRRHEPGAQPLLPPPRH